jgi:serine/threonine-protein phosphatase 6 regulatory ankyrin repeat subunit B
MKSWVDAFEELIGEYDVEFPDEKIMVLKHKNGNIYKCYLIEYPEYPDGKLINDIEFLNRYIENESNLDIRYEYDTTLLMWFIKYDEPGLALYLIKKGININEKNMYGQTALHYAASKMFPEVIEELLKNGAEINIIDDFGQTSLDIIELKYEEDVKNRENVRRLLKSYGAINSKSKNGA